MKEVFGKRIHVAGFAVTGDFPYTHDKAIPVMVELAQAIVGAIGMTCSHPPQITDYEPGLDGKSPGFIVTQPIYESAVVLDVWPLHSAFYAHVISCKGFDPEALVQFLNHRKYMVQDFLRGKLALP